jgi:hypothetical protein
MLKYIFSTIVTFGFLFTQNAVAAGPQDWDQNPENHAILDKIYSAHAEALESPTFTQPVNEMGWRLVALAFDLGLSAEGKVGTLTLKGSPGVQVYWRKKESDVKKAAFFEAPADDALNMELNDEMPMSEIERQVSVVAKTALSTAKIKNQNLFQEELQSLVRGIHQQFGGLGVNQQGEWEVGSYRFDISAEASGKIHLFSSAGAALRIRLEWHKTKKAAFINVADPILRDRREQIANLLAALTADLSALTENEGADFAAKSMRIGLGLSAKGEIGVTKSSLGAIVHVGFKRVQKNAGFTQTSATLAQIPIIDSGAGFIDLSHIDREKYRKGLRRAAGLGKFFMRPTSPDSKKTWKLHTIKVQYDMSLSGDIGVVTAGALVSSEIAYENKNF